MKAEQTAQTQPGETRPAFDAAGAALKLVELVRASRDEADRLRHVPPAMADALAEAGLFQMLLPRAAGGPQLAPLEVFRAVETISKADGSIGWCTMLASLLTQLVGWLAPEVVRELAGSPPDLRLAGSIRPQGRARPVENGYRIDGHWDFASGINHARWLMCPCVIMDGEKPALTANGLPRTGTFWLPASAATVLDTWHVMGLRGTGSHDFIVEDTFVPATHVCSFAEPSRHGGALYSPRLFMTWAWTATVANAFGIARGAMDAFIALASAKASTSSALTLRDRPLVQARVGEAEAILSAARAYVVDTVGTLWALADQGEPDLDAAVAQARLAITHGMHEAARSVDIVFHAAGTNAIYAKNPIERYFRDIHVAVQHGAALHSNIESAGKVLLGLRPADPGW